METISTCSSVVQNEMENDQDDAEVIQNNHVAVQDDEEDSSHNDSLSNSGTEEDESGETTVLGAHRDGGQIDLVRSPRPHPGQKNRNYRFLLVKMK